MEVRNTEVYKIKHHCQVIHKIKDILTTIKETTKLTPTECLHLNKKKSVVTEIDNLWPKWRILTKSMTKLTIF